MIRNVPPGSATRPTGSYVMSLASSSVCSPVTGSTPIIAPEASAKSIGLANGSTTRSMSDASSYSTVRGFSRKPPAVST